MDRACKSGKPTLRNFEYSGWLTEANHLGNVAYRVGKKLEWDAGKHGGTQRAGGGAVHPPRVPQGLGTVNKPLGLADCRGCITPPEVRESQPGVRGYATPG